MVTANVERLAGQAETTLDEKNVQGLATVAAASAGGVITAQTITDTVMNYAGMNPDPQTITEYGVSIGTKTLVAIGFGAVAAQLSGLALIAAAFMGLGSLASAGVDFVEGLLTTAPIGGGSGSNSSSAPRRSARSRSTNRVSATKTSSKTSNGATAAAGGGVQFR